MGPSLLFSHLVRAAHGLLQKHRTPILLRQSVPPSSRSPSGRRSRPTPYVRRAQRQAPPPTFGPFRPVRPLGRQTAAPPLLPRELPPARGSIQHLAAGDGGHMDPPSRVPPSPTSAPPHAIDHQVLPIPRVLNSSPSPPAQGTENNPRMIPALPKLSRTDNLSLAPHCPQNKAKPHSLPFKALCDLALYFPPSLHSLCACPSLSLCMSNFCYQEGLPPFTHRKTTPAHLPNLTVVLLRVMILPGARGQCPIGLSWPESELGSVFPTRLLDPPGQGQGPS